ncbi:MAG: hypothetical protein IJ553_01780 [Alloprevotella sp.]|nr:hypothetical protein [Alloprevotella sp.]
MMSFLNLFRKKRADSDKSWRVGGIEDFVTLIRVYYQAQIAQQLGISNLAALPDLRIFKQTLHVQTVNNRLGLGERNKCRQMLTSIYGVKDEFFPEIDNSIKKNCRNMQQMQQYLYSFQGFTQELMMVVGTLMKWKFRVPSFMKKALRAFTEKTIHDVLTKNDFKDAATQQSAFRIRQQQKQLGYSEEWMSEYVYHVISLAKKEPKADEKAEQLTRKNKK